MHSILVRDYMDQNPHAISASSNVREVVSHLLKEDVIGAPVIDDSESVIGYVSEQDCIKEMLNDAFFCEEPPSVKTVMKSEVMMVSPNAGIVEIAQDILDNHRKNFPVCDNGKLVGIISRRHILQALMENDEDCYLHH